MQQKELVVRNAYGLHARVAARITLAAKNFQSNVILVANGKRANARSLVAVMILAAGMGTRIYIETSGPDEAEALTAVARLIEEK